MAKPIPILLQTTIESIEDNWHIGRFSLLREYLSGLTDDDGTPLFTVDARDRGSPGQPDPILASLDESDYRELWLFAVDTGNGLTEKDCGGITRFRRWGGALLHPASAGVCYAANWLPEHAEDRLQICSRKTGTDVTRSAEIRLELPGPAY